MPGPDAAARTRQNWTKVRNQMGRASAALRAAQSAAPAGGGLQLVGARCCSPLAANYYRPRANSAIQRIAVFGAQRTPKAGAGGRARGRMDEQYRMGRCSCGLKNRAGRPPAHGRPATRRSASRVAVPPGRPTRYQVRIGVAPAHCPPRARGVYSERQRN